MDAAVESGADVVKLQVVFAEEILPPEAGLVPLPGGLIPLYEVFRSLQRPVDFYAALAEQTKRRGAEFLGTAFGERSVRLLEEIGVRAWKVASPELNHEPLLERLAKTGLPIILSTGVSLPMDVERALEVIRTARNSAQGQASSVILLHCLTSYPAPENQANLRSIPTMAARYNLPTGLSDHSLDPVLLPVLAAALGAILVEKHLCLSRDADGLDDQVALVPDDFARMTNALRHYSSADSIETVIDELTLEYDSERMTAALGSGVLGLAESEASCYRRTNRSLHAVGALKAGTRLNPMNTAILRTEKVLKPGIAPRHRLKVYGCRIVHDLPSGDGISWDDIE